MCAYSAMGDYWQQRLPEKPYYPAIHPYINQQILQPQVSRAEFDALKKDMEELKKLLKAAKDFDEAAGEPDCETDEKVALIRKLAKLVGVSMDGIA